ncbi:hypothetical protein BKA67DRAFT_529605 [Truncatella angustata]|uniref:Uncharacterized protein n=1 Tax=Truncatella angustata TaxID=152316 RepID=A0A9P8UWG7_9PEZI|nr:uncharacterized protein BKA67DRAFT_529605 [Truncatella angustata]KAH6659453.1 hypothetical protein BKA67DRAFT_529605 [Truncatella angustata]
MKNPMTVTLCKHAHSSMNVITSIIGLVKGHRAVNLISRQPQHLCYPASLANPEISVVVYNTDCTTCNTGLHGLSNASPIFNPENKTEKEKVMRESPPNKASEDSTNDGTLKGAQLMEASWRVARVSGISSATLKSANRHVMALTGRDYRKWASEMKVIATMTMALLPATFFAAVFSIPPLEWERKPAVFQTFLMFLLCDTHDICHHGDRVLIDPSARDPDWCK